MLKSNKFLSVSILSLTLLCPHKNIPFNVEFAQTRQEQMQGLMYRTSLEEDGGMFFQYEPPHPVSMWMKNTPLPLDMIFGDKTGRILAIYENTTPYSLDRIGPVKDTAYVLEVLGGTVAKQGITKACRVIVD